METKVGSIETESIKLRSQELERELASVKLKFEAALKEKDQECLKEIEKIKLEFGSKSKELKEESQSLKSTVDKL